MLPTPSTSHLNFSNIYEPAEDSYLLLDALSHPAQVEYLSSRFIFPSQVPLVFEVGPGSGIVLAFVAANAHVVFGRPDLLVVGVDINDYACRGAAETLNHNLRDTQKGCAAAFGDVVQGDLGTCLREGIVDVCIFNPPYVPSEEVPPAITEIKAGANDTFMRDSALLALATDGGQDGMEVTNRLLSQLDGLLSRRGVAYILLCAQNKPELVKRRLREEDCNWVVDTVHTSGKQGGWEKLQILRIARTLHD